jgi:hypothetical protein
MQNGNTFLAFAILHCRKQWLIPQIINCFLAIQNNAEYPIAILLAERQLL